jgi:ribonuclease-3
LKDPKTRLQEALQARALPLPIYTVEAITGEAHNQRFEVRCAVAALGLSASASGLSRRSAEQAAAQQLLQGLDQKFREDS